MHACVLAGVMWHIHKETKPTTRTQAGQPAFRTRHRRIRWDAGSSEHPVHGKLPVGGGGRVGGPERDVVRIQVLACMHAD